MKKLAILMNQRREERGTIDFDLPEPVIEFDEHGQMRGVTRAERTWANRLIEEFMLAANECVATWLEDLGVPSLYRIHEKPDPRRVVQFEELAASFGYSLGLGPLPVKRVQTRGERREARGRAAIPASTKSPKTSPLRPRMYQKLAAHIEGKPEERILSYLMLRSLSAGALLRDQRRPLRPGRAHLHPLHLAHSPLSRPHRPPHRESAAPRRRLGPRHHRSGSPRLALVASQRRSNQTGLAVRRRRTADVPTLALGDLGRKLDAFIDPPIPEPELAQIAEESSLAERRAAEAERELVEWKKVRFMQDRVGDEFAALVLNPAKYGLFVELTDLFVEGLVPIDTLRDDRYTFRENTHEIVGERTGRRFRAGDRVQVILDRILAQERKLQFALVEEELKLTGKKARSPLIEAEEGKTQKHLLAAPAWGQAANQKGQEALSPDLFWPWMRSSDCLRASLLLGQGAYNRDHKFLALECLDDADEPKYEESRDPGPA